MFPNYSCSSIFLTWSFISGETSLWARPVSLPTDKAHGEAWLAVGCFWVQLVGSGVTGGARVALLFRVFHWLPVLCWLPQSAATPRCQDGSRLCRRYFSSFLLPPSPETMIFSIDLSALQHMAGPFTVLSSVAMWVEVSQLWLNSCQDLVLPGTPAAVSVFSNKPCPWLRAKWLHMTAEQVSS